MQSHTWKEHWVNKSSHRRCSVRKCVLRTCSVFGKKEGGGIFLGRLIPHWILWLFLEVHARSEAICDNWRLFKNNEKYFLFHVKSSFVPKILYFFKNCFLLWQAFPKEEVTKVISNIGELGKRQQNVRLIS